MSSYNKRLLFHPLTSLRDKRYQSTDVLFPQISLLKKSSLLVILFLFCSLCLCLTVHIIHMEVEAQSDVSLGGPYMESNSMAIVFGAFAAVAEPCMISDMTVTIVVCSEGSPLFSDTRNPR